MDNKLLLSKAITLLYRESLVSDKQENSADLIRTALEGIKVPDVVIGLNSEREIITRLKRSVLEMCENPLEHEYTREDLLQTIQANCGDDVGLYENISQGINTEMVDGALKRSVVNLRKTFVNHFKEEAVNKILTKAAWECRHGRDKIKSFTSWVNELVTQLEPYQISSNKKDPAINGSVSIEDEIGVENIFATVQNEGSGQGVIRFGWQAFNQMLDGGARPGECIFLMALQHKWKSGLSLSLFKQIPIYNKPVLIDKNKKPLIIRISFEDPLKSNFQFLYKSLKENETGEIYKDQFKEGPVNDNGEPTKIPVVSPNQKAAYVTEKLKVNGWHAEFLDVNPIEWTYRDLCNLVIEREAQGYEVKVCMVDYLQKLPTTGCTQGPMGTDIRNMLERVKAFFAPRGTIFITPWQLSPEAKQLFRDGQPDFVKKLVGGGYTNGCRTLDQVYDIGILVNLENHNREWYLDIALDKLRRIDQPDDKHRRFALKFNNGKAGKGVVLEDIGKLNSAFKKPGAEMVTTTEESETYWDF